MTDLKEWRTETDVNSWRLWLHTQDLQKLKQDKFHAQRKRTECVILFVQAICKWQKQTNKQLRNDQPISFNGVTLCLSSILQGKPHSQNNLTKQGGLHNVSSYKIIKFKSETYWQISFWENLLNHFHSQVCELYDVTIFC